MAATTSADSEGPDLSHMGVTEDELYDGADPNAVAQLYTSTVPPPPPVQAPRVSRAQYVEIINVAMAVLAARLLGLIAVLGAVAMFGLAVYEPSPWRTYTVAAYAAVVLWPIVWLYLRRG